MAGLYSIALFFLLSGPNDEFLAGVVDGVTFCFDKVRSVRYPLYRDDMRVCKPLQVTLNFRSHSGVLNFAGGVLELMFEACPQSATKLGPKGGDFKDLDLEVLKYK